MTVNRCAIYVRKSTEHGLDMEFNSLQNQEESCKAYIASQSFNGWQYYKTYSDAAISGGTSVPGEHEAIIDKDLFNQVQMALNRNGNHKGNRYGGSPNLLTGKLFDIDGTKFTNQQTRKPGRPVKYYYAKSRFYIPSLSIDEIAMNTISEFLNSSMRDIPPDTALLLKRIDMQNMSYNQKRDFLKTIITKVVYSENKLTFYLVLNNELKRFISESFINENADDMTYIINKDAVIIERQFILSKYNKCNEYNCGKSGAISISDNNHLIVRAFARAFKYRELYEKNSDYKSIARAENVSESSVYRHLKLAYMNPHTINDIMSGKLQCSVDKLFNLPNML